MATKDATIDFEHATTRLTIEQLHFASKNPKSRNETVHITNGANGAFCGVDARRNGYRMNLQDRPERMISTSRVCLRCLAHLRDMWPNNITFPMAEQRQLARSVSWHMTAALADLIERQGWKVESSEPVMGESRTAYWISNGRTRCKVEI